MDELEVIYSYTRKDALADGEQTRISDKYPDDCFLFKHPVYFTKKVMSLVENSHHPGGVVWDLCYMSVKSPSRTELSPSTVKFSLIVENDREGCFRSESISHRGVAPIPPDFIEEGCPCYTLIAQVGATDFDNPAPAVTIMFPDEI